MQPGEGGHIQLNPIREQGGAGTGTHCREQSFVQYLHVANTSTQGTATAKSKRVPAVRNAAWFA